MNTDAKMDYLIHQLSNINDPAGVTNGNTKKGIKGHIKAGSSRMINSFANSLSYSATNEIKNFAKFNAMKFSSKICYYIYQPMYSTVGAATCNYLLSLDKKQYMKIADRWMRSTRKDAWFMSPYTIFFKKVDKATYVFARSCVDNNGGVYITVWVVGRKMNRELYKMTLFEKKANINGRSIDQINITYNQKEDQIETTTESITARSIDTIYIDHDVKNRIIKHIDNWLANEEVYSRAGIVFKTGILLHGEPGTGKTSFIKAISTHYGASIINVNPNDMTKSNIPRIKEAIDRSPELKIILFEDIDVITKTNVSDAENIKEREVLNGLMQMLDGTYSSSKAIYIATTNYKDRLEAKEIVDGKEKIEARLTRKGRFDITEELAPINRSVAEEMCKGFNISNSVLDGETFPINPSILQGKILEKLFNGSIPETLEEQELENKEKESNSETQE